jgi:hypothetical protein
MYKCKYFENGAISRMMTEAITKFRENPLMKHAYEQLIFLFDSENGGKHPTRLYDVTSLGCNILQ